MTSSSSAASAAKEERAPPPRSPPSSSHRWRSSPPTSSPSASTITPPPSRTTPPATSTPVGAERDLDLVVNGLRSEAEVVEPQPHPRAHLDGRAQGTCPARPPSGTFARSASTRDTKAQDPTLGLHPFRGRAHAISRRELSRSRAQLRSFGSSPRPSFRSASLPDRTFDISAAGFNSTRRASPPRAPRRNVPRRRRIRFGVRPRLLERESVPAARNSKRVRRRPPRARARAALQHYRPNHFRASGQ